MVVIDAGLPPRAVGHVEPAVTAAVAHRIVPAIVGTEAPDHVREQVRGNLEHRDTEVHATCQADPPGDPRSTTCPVAAPAARMAMLRFAPMAKPTYDLVLLPGDGIGVEVIAEARALVDLIATATGASFRLDEIPCN